MTIEPDFQPAALKPSPLKTLVVEDDPVMRMGLVDFFESHPSIQVIGQATNGYAACDRALQLRPDLVIMDIGLPELDGIAATKEIKSKLPEVRVMMLTSHTAEHEMVAALSSGADAYCVKGTSLERLMLAIQCVQEGAIYLDPRIGRQILKSLNPRLPSEPIAPLSQRELEVLKLLVEGKSNPEIAAALYLSVGTVKTHIRSIMNKLAVDDRVQAAVVALRSGLV
ncbi:response regulator [Egbenema bharatensis]|uniref:response regulator n=1 Tax=Egbenema bharatensis TaxID=3463334 RepID=UPI003A858F74